MLKIANLSIGYKEKNKQKVLVSNINSTIAEGKLVCLLGANGSGKSTLLRTISGRLKPLKGDIFLSDDDLKNLSAKQLAKRVSVVLTDKNISTMIKASEVVALGRYPYTGWRGNMQASDWKIIRNSFKLVGAENLYNREFRQLSDGEKQKVLVARALAQETNLILLDEVTSFLDVFSRMQLMQLLKEMSSQMQKLIILSTHDIEAAFRYANIFWLIDKQGKFYAGSPEDLVLQGVFNHVFKHEACVFDIKDGRFKIKDKPSRFVNLQASELVYFWTEQALKKINISISKDADIVIKVSELEERVFLWS